MQATPKFVFVFRRLAVSATICAVMAVGQAAQASSLSAAFESACDRTPEIQTLIARRAVPDAFKARTLVMLSRNSPYFFHMLSPAEARRDDLAYRDGVQAWREAGYASAEYGRDFLDEDFGDRTHLAASGGRKLAAVTAREVVALAQKLGYAREETK